VDMQTEADTAGAERQRPIEIIVNAEPKLVNARRLSFEEVVRLAFDDAVFNENVVYTVTYKRGPQPRREGTLVAGESVAITKGMIFNAKRTDKS
jgi:hypothetical protein